MEIIYYTLAALILYAVSDWILNTIEIRMEKRLPNRSLIFFVIILTLSMATFAVIRAVMPQPPAEGTQATGTPATQQSTTQTTNAVAPMTSPAPAGPDGKPQ